MKSPSARSNAAIASRDASDSSSTAYSGSSPAASACARSSRAQKPWIVPIQAPSAARACSRSPSSVKRPRSRAFSSAAAFSVKVIARTRSTGTSSSQTARTKRSTSTRVLPDPAPADRNSGPERSPTANACSSVNFTALAPADRRVAAAAAERAGVGTRPHGAAAHLARERAHGRARRLELRLELVELEPVVVDQPAADVAGDVAQEDAARPAVLARQRHVEPGHRPQPEQLPHGDHVERDLQPPVLVPARDRPDGAAALVVAHDGVAAADVDAVDLAGHRDVADLQRRRDPRPERQLHVLGLERRAGVGLAAQVAQEVELQPPHRRAHARLLGRELEVRLLGHERVAHQPLRRSPGSRA